MQILFQDDALLVVNKPAGIAVQPDKTGEPSLLDQASAEIGHPLFVVHRIDRPVSGAVVFAKTKETAHLLSVQFQEKSVQKTYLAVSGQCPDPPVGDLLHYFEKNETQNKSKAFTTNKDGRTKGSLSYSVEARSDRYFLLRIQLHTGKHHQIRAQLAAIGCPIKGDVKYGAKRGNPDRSIHLHAWKISFEHPVSQAKMALEADLPRHDTLWNALVPVK